MAKSYRRAQMNAALVAAADMPCLAWAACVRTSERGHLNECLSLYVYRVL